MPHVMKQDRERFNRYLAWKGIAPMSADFYASESTWHDYLLDTKFDEVDEAYLASKKEDA